MSEQPTDEPRSADVDDRSEPALEYQVGDDAVSLAPGATGEPDEASTVADAGDPAFTADDDSAFGDGRDDRG